MQLDLRLFVVLCELLRRHGLRGARPMHVGVWALEDSVALTLKYARPSAGSPCLFRQWRPCWHMEGGQINTCQLGHSSAATRRRANRGHLLFIYRHKHSELAAAFRGKWSGVDLKCGRRANISPERPRRLSVLTASTSEWRRSCRASAALLLFFSIIAAPRWDCCHRVGRAPLTDPSALHLGNWIMFYR